MAKIFVGMSGGVDSTAAAVILKEQGHEVTGLTLKLWDGASRCCDYDDILDAKKACWKLGIRHYVLNLKKHFKKSVVNYFISEYLSGRTPNPCAVCNEEIKFKALLSKVKEHGYDFAATGHYAAISKGRFGYFLKKAADEKKSQEYFLARLGRKSLARIIFPLGGLTKEQAREKVKQRGLYHDKKDSQEVCFLRDGEGPFEFVKRNARKRCADGGELWHFDGRKLKDLDTAYYMYTTGQRRGLNTGGGDPLYVVSIDPKKRRVTAGPRDAVMKKFFSAESLNMLSDLKTGKHRFHVKIRYRQPASPATVTLHGKTAETVFDEPQFAVTPGQLAVFYKGDKVIFSGYIK